MAFVASFPIRYGVFGPLLSILGCGPRFSAVVVHADRLDVHMGWAFRADIARTAVAGVHEDTAFVGGIGVHGWRGRWLVNGAASGLVAIEIAPAARAWVCGLPVRVHRLRVSVEDPAGLLQALRP